MINSETLNLLNKNLTMNIQKDFPNATVSIYEKIEQRTYVAVMSFEIDLGYDLVINHSALDKINEFYRELRNEIQLDIER